MQRLLVLLLTICLLSFAVTAQENDLPTLIFVKQTPVAFTVGTIADVFNNAVGQRPAAAQPVGGGLYRLDPDGTLTNLTPFDNIAVRDPEISYDGQRVLFSMKQGPRGQWQIHEMSVDGSGLRRVNPASSSNDWDPAYMPDGRILFVSDRLEAIARANENIPPEKLPEGQLFSMNPDGSRIQTINVHPHGPFNPQVGQNGLIYFTQWDLNDLRPSPDAPPDGISVSRFLIWEVFQDGSREGHPIFGQHVIEDFAGGFMEARELPNGDMIATLTRSEYSYGAGAIVRFTPGFNDDLHRYTYLTPAEGYTQTTGHDAGRYRAPYPLSDGRIVASFAPGPVWDYGESGSAPDFDLVLLGDEADTPHTVIHADPNFWDWQAVEVAPRPAPTLAEPFTLPEYRRYAIVNTMDVELRHLNADQVLNGDRQPAIEPGTAAAVRIFALTRPPAPYAGGDPTDQTTFRRLLGEAPVAPDGSFAAVVPPRTMLMWDVVDAAGNVLVTERFWAELAPGEVMTCSGCHSPRDGSNPGRTSNMALQNPVNLTGFDVDRDEDGTVDLLADYLAQQD